MKLTNRDVWDGRQALQLAVNLSPAPTVAVSMKLARNCRRANQVLEDIGKVLQGLAVEYDADVETVDADGAARTVREIPLDRRDAYQREIDELMDGDVEVDIRVISEAELLQCEEKRPGFEMPPGVLFGAWWMFEG